MFRVASICAVLCILVACDVAEAAPFEDDIDLDTLDADNGGDGSLGFRLTGCSGLAFVTSAGDINADGLGDFAAQCRTANNLVIVFGRDTGFPAELDWLNLASGEGFSIPGLSLGAGEGLPSVTSIGDVNNDGIDDLGVPGFGRLHVIYGSAGGFPDIVDVSSAVAAPLGFTITPASEDISLASSVGPAGDVNGDTIDDLVLGTRVSQPDGAPETGRAYVVFGSASGFPDSFSLDAIDGSNGFSVTGRGAFDQAGWAVDGIGDFDGDGFDDVAVASPFADAFQADTSQLLEAGRIDVAFGRNGAFPADIDLGDINRPLRDRFVFEGEAAGGWAGKSIAGIGDFNGDGLGDFAIGASRTLQVPGTICCSDLYGLGYILFGSTDFNDEGVLGRFLSAVAQPRGLRIPGSGDDRWLGESVGGGGDINDDGFDDVVITESRFFTGNVSDTSVYVLYGRAGLVPLATTEQIAGDVGFRMYSRGSRAGRHARVDIVPDLNGDGIDDILMNLDSRAYVMFGRADSPALVPVIVWRHQVDGRNWAYLMDGSNVSSSAGINTVATDWNIVGNGDYNADGNPDLFWRNSATGENWMYLMDGATILSSVGVNTVSDQAWVVVGNGDYDGDGNSDVLWRNTSTGQNWMYLMNGASIESSIGVNYAGTIWGVVGNGDYNGDGNSDVLWRNSSTGDNWLYLMNGASIASSVALSAAGTDWNVVGNGDYDGDGNSDILWRNAVTGQNWMYLMNGSLISASVGVNSVSDLDWKVAGSRDFNGDGRSDVLWRNSSTGQNWLYLMSGPAISASEGIDTVTDQNWQIVNVD